MLTSTDGMGGLLPNAQGELIMAGNMATDPFTSLGGRKQHQHTQTLCEKFLEKLQPDNSPFQKQNHKRKNQAKILAL